MRYKFIFCWFWKYDIIVINLEFYYERYVYFFGKIGVYFFYFYFLKFEGRRVNGWLFFGVGVGYYLKMGIWFN